MAVQHKREIPISEMTDEQIVAEMVRAEELFNNRGEHSGSPGEWAYERMNEIETEQKRRAEARPERSTAGCYPER